MHFILCRSSCRDCGCSPDDHAHEKNPDPNKRRVGASRGSGRKTYETTESDVTRARDSRKHSSNYSVDLVGSRDQRSTASNGSLSSSSGASNGVRLSVDFISEMVIMITSFMIQILIAMIQFCIFLGIQSYQNPR